MTSEIQDFVEQTIAQFKPLEIESCQAMWQAATTGTEAANQRQKEAEVALMHFWGNPQRYATAKRFHESGAAADPLLARTVQRIYLSAAKAQQDEETIQRLTQLEAQLRQAFYNFRAEIAGSKISDNQLDDILRKSTSSNEVQEAWLASKQIGRLVADTLRQLARVRNAAARAQGFRDHFQRSLTLNEIDETQLLTLFGDLEEATRKLFQAVKAQIDALRSKRFAIPRGELRPWHYGDRFFQESPELGELDEESYFTAHDPVALAKATYEGLGLEVDDILQRSDLYPRDGKDQHAFCLDMDHEGDVRTLNNIVPGRRWNETLLHELGHATYDKSIDRSLPWPLRTPPHALSTEAIANMMGSLVSDRTWLETVLGLNPRQAGKLAKVGATRERAEKLIFARWCMVMTHFERGLYADPEQDLDELWWDLVQQFQELPRPDGLQGGEWAAKYHISLAPVYYHSYQLGQLVSAQVYRSLVNAVGGFVGRPQAGRWLVERVFRPGSKVDWASQVRVATGEPLNPRYFIDSIR